MSTPTFLGVEIGGTKLQVAAGTPDGKILQCRRIGVAVEGGAEGIRQAIEQALPDLISAWNPSAAAVGFGGPVNRQTGRIARSHQIEGWSEFGLQEWFAAVSGLPTTVENDANIAGLAEAHHGTGAGANPVFYVTLGSGVGGGLVVDGRIYRGATPGEAELGHLRLDRQGTTLESRCSGWAVDARIRSVCQAEPKGLLARLVAGHPGGEARHLRAALEAGDEAATAVLGEMTEDLAFGLSHVVHLMHPERIVLGGGLSLLGEPLRTAVASALSHHLMEVFRPGPDIGLSLLGEDVVPVGCMVACELACSD